LSQGHPRATHSAADSPSSPRDGAGGQCEPGGAAVAEELIGREADVQACSNLLANHGLVTIVGPGGIGKTSLARALARLTNGKSCFVDLTPATPGVVVADVVARSLGRASAELDLEPLLQKIADDRLLLVLDNCEHVVAEVAGFVDALLGAHADARVLATSQRSIKSQHEQLFPLESLELPPDETPAGVTAAPATALFIRRARALNPRFLVDQESAVDIAAICRHLDGIALAIELAAGRVALLGTGGVRARLDNQLNLLTGGGARKPVKHQTLRAALDWSFQLLEPDEQSVFCRLGAFGGSFSLEAAREVAADGLDEWTLLDTLSSLIDKSLVVIVPTKGPNPSQQTPRYALLQTMRDFTFEQLERSGTLHDVMDRFCRWIENWLRNSDMMSSIDQEKFQKVRQEHNNISRSIQWATLHNIKLASGIAELSRRYWISSGEFAEGITLLENLAMAAEVSSFNQLRMANILCSVCTLAYRSVDLKTMEKHTVKINEIALRNNDMGLLAMSSWLQGTLHALRQDDESALPHFRDELEYSLRLGDRHRIVRAHSHVAEALNVLGRFSEAKEECTIALSLFDDDEEIWEIGFAHSCLGSSLWGLGNLQSCLEHKQRAIRCFEKHGDVLQMIIALSAWARVLCVQNKPAPAMRLMQHALQLGKDRGGHLATAAVWALQGLGH